MIVQVILGPSQRYGGTFFSESVYRTDACHAVPSIRRNSDAMKFDILHMASIADFDPALFKFRTQLCKPGSDTTGNTKRPVSVDLRLNAVRDGGHLPVVWNKSIGRDCRTGPDGPVCFHCITAVSGRTTLHPRASDDRLSPTVQCWLIGMNRHRHTARISGSFRG